MKSHRTVLPLGLLLGLLIQGHALADRFTERVERAVVVGAADDLRELRATLLGNDSDGYNFAYVNWRLAQTLESKGDKKKLLKEAQKVLEQRLELDSTDAEAHALRGTVIGERINGAFAGMFLGPKASKSLKRAFELEPENPRVALQRGVGFFFTPKTFGGGQANAEKELLRARELFAREQSQKAWPNWGRVDVLAWLGQTLARAGKYDEARNAYHEALGLEPDQRWIREELLPDLARLEAKSKG